MTGEASRANGAKGGRPKGSLRGMLLSEEYEARKRARKTLQELCQQQEEDNVAVLQAIAGDPEEPANARISAISLLFDRGRGKAVQPELHGGALTLQVITGVPRGDNATIDVTPQALSHNPGLGTSDTQPHALGQQGQQYQQDSNASPGQGNTGDKTPSSFEAGLLEREYKERETARAIAEGVARQNQASPPEAVRLTGHSLGRIHDPTRPSLEFEDEPKARPLDWSR